MSRQSIVDRGKLVVVHRILAMTMGSTLADRQWKLLLSAPIFNEKVKADRRGRRAWRGKGKGERNLARGETSRVASTKSLVSGFRPVSSWTAFDAETRINSSVEMESRWGTGEKQRPASCYAAWMRRIRTGFDSMSANLSSDKADRSRFRLSRVPNGEFRKRYHVSTRPRRGGSSC